MENEMASFVPSSDEKYFSIITKPFLAGLALSRSQSKRYKYSLACSFQPWADRSATPQGENNLGDFHSLSSQTHDQSHKLLHHDLHAPFSTLALDCPFSADSFAKSTIDVNITIKLRKPKT
jgi:hypothetical protein